MRRYSGLGASISEPHDMEIDRNGFIYVTGESSEPPPSITDYVTIKYNQNGDSLWTRKYDGPEGRLDIGQALEVDTLGNVYVTGGSESLHDTIYYPDITTIKYSSVGNSLWVNRYTTINSKSGISYDIALDNVANSYITGFLQDSNLNENICNIRYNNDGVIQWARIIDGSVNIADVGYKIKVDRNNYIYISGVMNPNTLAHYFILKYDINGVTQWLRTYRDSLNGVFEDMVIDAQSNSYIAGGFNSVKFDVNGNFKWSQPNIVNSKYYVGKSMLLDTNLNIYMFGDYYTLGPSQTDFITIKYSQLIGIIPISGNLPMHYKIYYNYPNPFNPFTNIIYQIKKNNVNVKLIVYDVSGKELSILIDRAQNSGTYKIDFRGEGLSSGIYFYSLLVNNVIIDTKKMILVK